MREFDCLVFRMNGADSASSAFRLCDTLAAAGHKPAIVPFWAEFIDFPENGRHFELPLLPTSIDSAPRISGFAFIRQFGRDLDLIDLSAHTYAAGEIRADTVLLESVWNQRMRGIAQMVDRLLELFRPEFVFVPHGAEIVSRIVAEMAGRRGCRIMYWESPFFPGFHYVDPAAPHFFRGAAWIDQRWPAHVAAPTDPARQAAARRFVTDWRAARTSKYTQSSDRAELAALDAWLSRGKGAVLFIPGQIAYDANVTVSLGSYADLHSIYARLLRQVPADWRIVFKHHPKGPLLTLPEIDPDRLFHAFDIAVHDIFERAAVVATHSSNVGLEAILCDMPVIAWGTPVYGGKGLTTDAPDVSGIAAILKSGDLTLPPWERVLAFIDLLIGGGLVPEGNGARLAALMAQASAEPPPARLGWYGDKANRIAAAVRTLDADLRADKGMTAALAALPGEMHDLLLSRVPDEVLLRHRLGGPVAAGGTMQPSLDLAPLAAYLPAPVIVSADELHERIEPQRMMRDLLAQAGPGGTVVITAPNAPQDPGSAVQRLVPSDIATLVDRAGVSAGIDLFGVNGVRLFDSHANRTGFMAVVRPGAAAPLSPTERAAILDLRLRPRTYRLPALSFHHREPVEAQGDALLLRPDGRGGHVIFGPYIALPPGRWTATFRFDHKRSRFGFADAGLILDIFGAGDGVKGSHRCGPRDDLAGSPPALDFTAVAGVRYEFRIFSEGVVAQAPLTFHGIDLDFRGAD